MMYEWQVQGFYTDEWECLTVEETREDALEQAHVYDENEPGVPHRVRRGRIEDEVKIRWH